MSYYNPFNAFNKPGLPLATFANLVDSAFCLNCVGVEAFTSFLAGAPTLSIHSFSHSTLAAKSS
jgi:hypothetical protein